ncbi:MAG: acetolactate synthase [Planctomycetota bacterium]
MESDKGSGAGTKFETMRGRNFPALRQFTIFLENRVGQLLEVVRRFEGTGIRICALSISDAAECSFVRFLVNDADRGREILERSGLALIETDLIGVQLPEGPQPLLRVCTALLQAELNIIQTYPLIIRPLGKPAVAIMVDNIEMAMETLNEKGFTIVTEGDLDDNPSIDQ